jgi:hypothetical protein
MEDVMGDLTRDELRARAAAAGLAVPEEWLAMVGRLLSDALAPLRRADGHTLRTVEPAVTFDATGDATGNEGA